MNEIITLPKSLKQQIMDAQALLSNAENTQFDQEKLEALQNQNQLQAIANARAGMEVLNALAKQVPELLILMQVISSGVKGIKFETTEVVGFDQPITTQNYYEGPLVQKIERAYQTHTVTRVVKFL